MARADDDSWWWLAGGGVLAAGLYLWVVRPAAGRMGGAVARQHVTTAAELARLAALEPDVRARLELLAARMLARGIRLYWASGYRSPAQQAALVAKGRSATINSWHRAGRAIDVYPIDELTGKPDTAGHNEAAFRALHQEWHRLGGFGLAYKPYPAGPRHTIKTSKGPVWDAGHLEHHGSFTNAVAAIESRAGKLVA